MPRIFTKTVKEFQRTYLQDKSHESGRHGPLDNPQIIARVPAQFGSYILMCLRDIYQKFLAKKRTVIRALAQVILMAEVRASIFIFPPHIPSHWHSKMTHALIA